MCVRNKEETENHTNNKWNGITKTGTIKRYLRYLSFFFVFFTFYNHTHARTIIIMILEDTIQRRSKRIRDTFVRSDQNGRIERYSYSYLYLYSWTSMLIFGSVTSHGSFPCHPSVRSGLLIQYSSTFITSLWQSISFSILIFFFPHFSNHHHYSPLLSTHH